MGELEALQQQRARFGVRLLACGILALIATALPGAALKLDWAVAFSGIAIALGLASFQSWAALRIVAALVVAFGLLSLAQDLFTADASTARLILLGDCGIALLGSAILVARRNASLSRLLALPIVTTGALSVLGYLYDIPSLYELPFAGRMGLVEAVLLIAAGCGVVFLRPESGLPAALLDRSEAARELRRLVPAALLLPVALGGLVLAGERAGWYDSTLEIALLVIGLTLALLALATVSYVALRRSEQARRRVRAELAASEAHYRRTFEHAQIGIAHLAADGRWLLVNERLCEILGYDAPELLEKTFAEVSLLQEREIDGEPWERLRRGEIEDYAVEHRFENKAGETVHADVRLVREEDEAGALRHLIVVLQDITGRKLSEDTLRVYERALAATQNGVLITDARQDDHPIVYANAAFSKITGYALSEVVGRNCRFLNEKAREQLALDEVRRAIAAGEACSVLLRNHRKDGEAFWNQLSIAPVDDPTGRITHFVGVMVDASERMEAVAEREALLASARRAWREAESANQAKDRFLSVVSHELRSPLNAILAWTSLLRDRPGEDVVRTVDAIEASVHSQTRLVNDLLDASRIRTGSLEIEPAHIDLEPVVRSAVDHVAPSAREKDITLELATHGPAFASADAERIGQVVRNLVENALKFTPRGGHVGVTLSEADESWRLTVRDDGRGVADEALPRIFEEFWQEDRGSSSRGRGLGLGLLIVRHLVELHGGEVRVESGGEDRGTTVRVDLPKADGLPTEPAQRASAEPHSLNGVEVVVVDDDEATVAALGAALDGAGALSRLARSVPDALLLLERRTPDVLVSDIGLPDRDGFDLIRCVRRLGEPARSMLAIAVTGLAGPEERRRIRRAGFDAYLVKPIEPDVLIRRIARLRARRVALSTPARRVLILDADAALATELVAQLRKLGHEVREARDVAEALRNANRFEPQLILARASAVFDVSVLAEQLATRGVRADLVGLVDDESDLNQKGFDLTLARPLDLAALDRWLRFSEEP